MFKFIRRNSYIIALIFIVFAFLINFIFLSFAKDNNVIYISKISGDENVLKDIEISGIIHDKYSGASFKLNDRKVCQEFMYYSNDEDYYNNRTILNNYSLNDEYGKRSITLSSGTYRFSYDYYYTHYDNDGDGYVYLTKYADKDFVTKHIQGYASCSMHESNHWHGTRFIEELSGKLYFTIRTCEFCKGKSSIYEVSDFSKIQDIDKPVIEGEGYRKLADIDLEDGKVAVNGMFMVEDNLCVILVNNKKIQVKAFNLKEEKFTEPFEITLKHMEAYPCTKVNGYVNGNTLSLLIDNVYTLEISDQISLVSEIDIAADMREQLDNPPPNYSGGFYDVFYHIADMTYKNGKLYIVYKYNLRFLGPLPEPDENVGKHLEVAVYDKSGNRIFSGKIESTINDDNIWWQGYVKNTNRLNWEWYKQRYEQILDIAERSFEQIKIY